MTDVEKNIEVIEGAKFIWEGSSGSYKKDGVTVSAKTLTVMGHIEFCNYMREEHLIELVPIK